ncbi:MAG: hypothetical protein DRI86_01875 [Bacteroidetes bacterium]|nr:MAG: hypothetical protein DRI86_01875 [Bacteroidota bacterium]
MFRIAIIGPESSGKSTLARFIEKEFDGYLVDEYAREYLLNFENPSKYSMEDLIEIAKVQFDKSTSIDSNKKICICDTEMLTMKIWAEDKFKYCPKKIETLFQNQKFDLYILCKPDIKWEFDILREDEDRRDYIFDIYKKYCNVFDFNYIEIKGDRKSRNNIIKKYLSN